MHEALGFILSTAQLRKKKGLKKMWAYGCTTYIRFNPNNVNTEKPIIVGKSKINTKTSI
jgi:hypothetical protein